MTENLNNNEKPNLSGNDYLAELIKSVSEGSQPEARAPSDSAKSSGAGTDILSSLLSNPELIAKLPSIIATVKPIIELLGSTSLGGIGSGVIGGSATAAVGAPASATNTQNSIPETLSADDKAIPASVSHSGSKGGDRRAELLCALKPYLCEERRQAIDYVIKLGRLGDVLKSL